MQCLTLGLLRLLLLLQGTASTTTRQKESNEQLAQLRAAAAAAADGSGGTTVSRPPSMDDLQTACPQEARRCLADALCEHFMQASSETLAEEGTPPPREFMELVVCFQRSPIGEERRRETHATRSRIRRAAEDIKCPLCLHVVKDLWSAHAANMHSQPIEKLLPMQLNRICHDAGHVIVGGKGKIISRWAGLFNILPCNTAGTRCTGPGQEHVLVHDGGDTAADPQIWQRSQEPSRRWHTGVYALVCAEHLLPLDQDIAATFRSMQKHMPNAARTDTVTVAHQVAAKGCESLCAGQKWKKMKTGTARHRKKGVNSSGTPPSHV
jgi:hypothetical protein